MGLGYLYYLNGRFNATFHLLYPVKCVLVDDGLMGVFHKVHFHLALVLFFLARQKIRRVGLLHQNLAYIFLVAQHPVNGGSTPLRFSCDRFDAMALRIFLDLPHPVALDVQLKNFSNDLGLLLDDLQLTVWIFRIAKELRMVQDSLSTPHAVADAELDVLTAELALGLIQSRQLVDDAVTGS